MLSSYREICTCNGSKFLHTSTMMVHQVTHQKLAPETIPNMLHKIHSLNLDKHIQNYSGKYMKIFDLKFIPQITSDTRDL